MPSTDCTRRRALTVGCLALTGLAGCLTGNVDVDSNVSPTATTNDSGTDDEQTNSTPTGEMSVAGVSVSDFVEYLLAGVHPHVHARRDTQYVVVSVDSPLDDGAVRERLNLQLDGETVSLAERQPVPWESNTTDVAFAVSKDDQYERGVVTDGEAAIHSLSAATLERSNNPPRFRVSDLSVSPVEILPDEQTTATVHATVENVGDGPGTFGASLKGNLLSASATLTTSVDSGATTTLDGTTRVVGDPDGAPVRLDWGRDEWSTTIPVEETTAASTTTTE